jgi:hypothetical protein
MLSGTGLAGRYPREQARRAMPQLHLNCNHIPIPETPLWDDFDDEPKRAVLAILSRLLVKAMRDHQQELTKD